MSTQRSRKRAGRPIPFDETASAEKACDWPGCTDAGEHRAPRSRENLKEYFWFCLDHVRVYNKAWNYYAGMSEDEVERDLRRDTVWHRPTWPLGAKASQFGFSIDDLKDGFGLFGGAGDADHGRSAPSPSHGPEEIQALAVLGLKPPIDLDRLKQRYKELVKIHHPDANGGDKAAEERFKQVNQAYNMIMARLPS